jgi:hypothetical protein
MIFGGAGSARTTKNHYLCTALLHEGGVADGRDMVGFNHHNQNTP